MASALRLLTRKLLIIANVGVVVLFLLSCIAPWVNPRNWWIFGFLSLGFPILLLLNILCMVAWLLIRKPHYAFISGIALLLGIRNISGFFAFRYPKSFDYTKKPGTLRVVSWNVARFIELKRNNNSGSLMRLKMFELLRRQDADVLCLQEFHTSTNPAYYDNITPIQKELGYPYYYFSFDPDGDNHYYSSIIFSRHPFADTGRIRYPRPTLPQVLLYADIIFNTDTIRVFNTHLQSNQFGKLDYDRIENIKTGGDSLLASSRSILGKIKKGFTRRSIQAEIVQKIMDDSPYPRLLCTDLNDVPNSYTYQKVRGHLQDAFLKKGFGIGRTFSRLSPTLRIDYIFADPDFKIIQFNRITEKLSDHYMLVADLELKASEK